MEKRVLCERPFILELGSHINAYFYSTCAICINTRFVSYSAIGIGLGPASVAALRLGADDDSLSPLRPWLIHATRTAPITVTLSPPSLYTSPF